VISPSQRPVHTQDNTAQKYENKHPCLKRIRTHGLSDQATKKAYASYRETNENGGIVP
jgi:hypothetical protein